MARRFHRGLLLGTSVFALVALAGTASAQNLTNPSGSTVAPGFIKVDPGETFDNVFNFGTITGNGALGAGIEVEGTGTVLGDVRNRGSGIIALTGATATGILVDGTGVSIGDDVDNFGLIEIDTTVLGYGIKVTGTSQFIGGDIANRGEGVINVSVVNADSETGVQSATATASDVSAYGIYVVAGVTGIDDVANFGVMHVEAISTANAVASGTAFAFASASLTGEAIAVGISLGVTSIAGAVINAGFLEVDAVAHAAAIAVATGPGASAQVGNDAVTASATAIGIDVDIATLTGGFANVGIVDADAVAETIDHAVANATAGDADAFLTGTSITRYALASATGVDIEATTSIGGILTLGPINDAAQALVDIELTANAATGDAHAYIEADEGIFLSAYAFAVGLIVSNVSTIEEGVFLAGDVSISASAVVEVDLLATAAGSATAYIQADGATIYFFASASASGVNFSGIGLVDGDFVNQGDIGVDAIAAIDVSIAAHGGEGDALAFLSASSSELHITASAFAIGLSASITTVTGDFENSGDIDVLANAGIVLAVSAYATDGGATAYIWSYESMNLTASASATGLSATITNVDGDFSNAGDIAATAIADIEIDVAAHAAFGDATAYIETTDTSIDIFASASAVGLVADIVSVDGSFSNSGYIGADAIATIDVSVVADASSGNADAHIAATTTSLSITANASVTGLSASITTLTGDFVNSGDIDAVANAAVLVSVSANAANGDATAYISASSIFISASVDSAYGIYATITDIGGAFINSGDIALTAVASVDVDVAAHAVGGSASAFILATTGSLSISASVSAYGLYADIGTIGGDFTNSGAIAVDAVASIDVALAATADTGNAIAYLSSSNGGIDISASVTAYGLFATITSVGGDFANSGEIDLIANAAVVVGLSASATSGSAQAYIQANTTLSISASVSAYGLFADITDIDGSFTNSGGIDVAAVASVDVSLTADAGNGNALAYISSTGSRVSISADATAYGLFASITNLGGDFANSGEIDVVANAAIVVSLSAYATSGSAQAYIQANTSVSITADASAYGLFADITDIDGSFTNSGEIDVAGVASVDVSLVADANGGNALAFISSTSSGVFISASATVYGLFASVTSIGGDFVNSGEIDLIANAAVVVGLSAAATGGSAQAYIQANTSVSISAFVSAYGLFADITDIDGNFTNSGDIDVAAVASVDVSLVADANGGNALAFISSTSSEVSITASATGYGLFASITNIGGDFANTGEIDLIANAAILVSLSANATSGSAQAYIQANTSVSITADASAYGLFADITDIDGNFTNSGGIDVAGVASVDVSLVADANGGNALAFISSTSSGVFISADVTAYGLFASITNIGGDFTNSGEIDLIANAAVLVSLSASATSGSAQAYIQANTSLSISASVSAYGLFADITDIDGSFTNSGDIDVAGVASIDVSLVADATSNNALAFISSTSSGVSISANATAYGLFASITNVGGDFVNTGEIDVIANAAILVSISANATSGSAQAYIQANTSVSISADASAYGLFADITDIDGNFTNSGGIDVAAVASVDVSLTADANGGNALAFISSTSSGIFISADVTAYGVFASITTVGGDFANSGEIDVIANAAVLVSLSASATSGSAQAYIHATSYISISADASAYGLFADVTTVVGDFANSGEIDVAAIASVDVSLTAEASGGNALAYISSTSKAISIAATAYAFGLAAVITTVGGDFLNSGDIDAIAGASVIVGLSAYAESGNATAYISAPSSIYIFALAHAVGLDAVITTVGGDFSNSGYIGADAIATVDVTVAAEATTSSAKAFIHSPSTTISIYASASAAGLFADIGTIGGDFTNSGDIDVVAAASVDLTLSADAGANANAYVSTSDDIEVFASANATGAFVSSTSIGGAFDNSGDISVLATATLDVALTAYADTGNAFAYISATSNDIDISASATAIGIYASISTVGGDFVNSGDLDVIANAALVMTLSASATSGSAQAFIQATSAISISASATATGIYASIDSVGGNFSNSGAIDAMALASLDVSLTADGSSSALAYISATSDSVSVTASASATGLHATITALIGDFANSGEIDAIANAALVLALSASATSGAAQAYVLAGGSNSLTISASASATGLNADIGSIGGSFSNSGAIAATAIASADISLSADAGNGNASAYLSGTSIDIGVSASASGLDASIGTLVGDFANSGEIDAIANAALVLALSADATSGNAQAYVAGSDDVSISATVSATGLHADIGSIGGDFSNSGDIDATAVASVDVSLIATAGTGDADAYIAATSDDLDISASASATGLYASISTLVGDFTNSGEIDAIANAALVLSLSASATSGTAQAYITASQSVSISASASAIGIYASIDSIGGGFSNSGAIESTAVASAAVSLTADADTGNALAYISSSSSNGVTIQASASATGIYASITALVGGFANSGEIDVVANAALVLGMSASATAGDATVRIDADDSVSISALASATGIYLTATSVGGQYANSGEIDVLAVADLEIDLTANAPTGNADAHIHASDTLSIRASASAYGLNGSITTLTGGFANSGDITAGALATLDLSLDANASGVDVAYVSGSNATFIAAVARAYGVYLSATTIGDDVTNNAEVVALASAFATTTGLDTAKTVTATALAVAFFVGTSGTILGDVVNSGLLAANAHAEINGSALGTAVATAVGLDVQMNVTGNVINSGTIVAQASASSAYAYGIRVVGHSIAGSLQNTGIIAAFATGSVFEEAFAIDVSLASGPTLIEQLDGLIIGDIDLRNAFADTIEFSGGEIFGDLFGDGTDDLLAYAGVDDVLNLSGDIDGFDSINVNFPTATSATAPVELRLGGDVTNTASLNVNAHGTLVVGLTSSINVTTYSQDPDGTTLFEIAPSGVSGQIVPGTANLAGAVGIRPQAGLYADNESYWIIDGGVINGTYDEVLSTALLEVDDEYIGNDVFLNVTRVPFDGLDGMTHNQGSVGGALEEDYGDIIPGTDFADVVGLLFGLSEGEYLDALDDLAGAEHAQMLKIGAGAIRSINNALLGRLAIVRGLTAEQMASVDQVGLAFTQVAATGDVDLHMDLAQAEAQAVAAPGDTGVWARVFGATSTLDGDDEAPGFDTEGGGASIGIDHRLSPDLVIGIYGGYAHTDADFDSNADGSVDTYQVGAYAGWASGALHVDGLVAGAWQSYELDRTIDFLGRNASSDYDGWGLAASAEAGYDVALGSTAVLEPVVGLDYVHLETNGFTEDGADSVSLAVEDGSYDSLVSTLGVRLTATVDAGGGVSLVPTAMLSWEHEFLEADGAFTARFDGSPGATFEIIGSDDEADAAVLNLGLAVVSENMTAFVAYDGRFTGDATSHQGTIGIRFGF